jgi:hypothetical protein
MTFAPDDIYECPSCKMLIRGRNLGSGNGLGAVQYSDTYWFLPFMPSYPDFTRCQGCGTFFKLSSLPKIGTYDRGLEFKKILRKHLADQFYNFGPDPKPDSEPILVENPEWKDADVAQNLTLYELAQAIEQGAADTEEDLLTLRRLLWFQFNDRVRDGKDLFQNEGDEHLWRSNLEAFLDLLTKTDANSLQMRAEILRYFGKFDEAILVLKCIRFPRDPKTIDFLIDQCKRGNQMVVEIE